MDGQRRVAQQVSKLLQSGNDLQVRFAARTGAVLLLGMTILHGIVMGEYLRYEGSPWMKIPGKLSSVIGMAADDISIKGLVNQDPELLLTAIGIRPGNSLIGFDAATATKLLQNLDWISSADVQTVFPNRLDITVKERVPFALWQQGTRYYVVDRTGSAMGSVDPLSVKGLPLVSGEGAQLEVANLVNQLEANPAILMKVKAAARLGQRRWNLYLDTGVAVQLPEKNVELALAKLQELEMEQNLLSKGISNVDLRFPDRVIVGIAEVREDKAPQALKLSQVE